MNQSCAPRDDLSRIVVGTAGFGGEYGGIGQVSEHEIHDLIDVCLSVGLCIFDTAPAYGEAENRLGKWLPKQAQIWTKLEHHLLPGPGLAADVERSLEASLGRLRRDRVEVLQWHNWPLDLARDQYFARAWQSIGRDPRVGSRGASTYGARDAIAAAASGLFDLVQVEWNLLNQGVVRELATGRLPQGVTIAVRSVFLQGVLWSRGPLPSHLAGLGYSLEALRRIASDWGVEVGALAIRAALDLPGSPWVILGLNNASEVPMVIKGAALPHLTREQSLVLTALDRTGDSMVDPRTWSPSPDSPGPL